MTFAPLSAARLKKYSALLRKKQRREQGLYLVSGQRAVQGALSCMAENIECLLLEQGREDLLADDLGGTVVYSVSSRDFKRLAEEKSPQGIAAVARIKLKEFKPAEIAHKAVFLEEINDPGNLGTILRGAAWFGYNAVLLSPGCADPFNPKSVRASAGYLGALAIYENIGLNELAVLKSDFDRALYGADINGTAAYEIFFKEKHVLAFGSEAHGLPAALQDLIDARVTIPRAGRGESLNLSMAASILMYQATATKS